MISGVRPNDGDIKVPSDGNGNSSSVGIAS